MNLKKRPLSALLAAVMLLLCITSAFAASGTIDEAIPDWENLNVVVSVSGTTSTRFKGSVDGSDTVELPAEEYPAEEVGHIIVIDLGYTWTKSITIESIKPVIKAYLATIPSGHVVKFIVAEGDGTTPGSYMSVSEANSFVDTLFMDNKDIARTGSPSYTSVDSALAMAFTEAATTDNAPTFKCIFALVDLGNSNASSGATSIRSDYIKEGGSFLVTVAAIYPTDYMADHGTSAAAKVIKNNEALYNGFAQSNGTSLLKLPCGDDGNVTTTRVSNLQHNRSYYAVNLAPLHDLIDYSVDTHEFVITATDGRTKGNERVFSGVTTNELPASKATPTPEPTTTPTGTPTPPPTPTPTPAPTPTPDPYMVRLGDETEAAVMVIRQLNRLYYLDDMPAKYDNECAVAFVDFCAANGIKQEANVSVEAYNQLMSGEAIPKTTATPTPTATPVEVTLPPTPVPPVYNSAESTKVSRTIRLLESLNYLEEGKKNRWDSECMYVFQQMCEDNRIPFPKDQEYIDDEWYTIIVVNREYVMLPKETPTPVPVATTPPPATIPPEGFALYDVDTEDSTFIAQMQTVLKALNLYEADVAVKIGEMDQATMDAVILYCTTYGFNLSSPNGVERNIVTDIITNGGNRTAYVAPEPALGEQIVEFLQRDVMLGDFAVKMWMLVALVVALIFIILLIVILTNRKANDHSGSSFPVKNGKGRNRGGNAQSVPEPNPNGSSFGGSSRPMSMGDSEETLPVAHAGSGMDNDEVTVKLGSGINVTLTISGGISAGVRRVLIGAANYVIGRPAASGASCDLALEGDRTISRKHAALSYQQNQLYLFSLSENGTRVNGQAIDGNRGAGDSEETLPLNAAASRSGGGYAIKRGDTIEIGNYRITVSW